MNNFMQILFLEWADQKINSPLLRVKLRSLYKNVSYVERRELVELIPENHESETYTRQMLHIFLQDLKQDKGVLADIASEPDDSEFRKEYTKFWMQFKGEI